jgi:hypothetical protein
VALEKFPVRNRWSGEVQFTAEIEVTPGMTQRVKLGLAVKWGVKNNANLACANLACADLARADLARADLADANLARASIAGADWLPKIENVHQAVYAAASKEGALDMSDWHADGYCGTTHCRAGWVVVLAGEGGKVLEGVLGTNAAAALIYKASDPSLERVPDWTASNENALADMKRLAEIEAGASA